MESNQFIQPIPHTARAEFDQSKNALYDITVMAIEQMEQPDHGDLANAIGAIRLVELAAAQARRKVVERMRAQGDSWEKIGDALGISRQAAHERFSL